MYNKKVMQHFMHPKNMGELKDADAVGKAGNIYCGDFMQIYIKTGKDKRGKLIIKDIKFKTLGCAAAISTSSIVTGLAKRKTFDEALKIKNTDVIESLDGLPVPKIHCSLLAVKALREAIYVYFKKNKIKIPSELKKTHKQVEEEIHLTEKRYKHE